MHTSRIFLLTHPVWDVTKRYRLPSLAEKFLLTHPVWDVTRTGRSRRRRARKFLLTHPVWDVTIVIWILCVAYRISTHTSRVGCDTGSIYCS